MFVKLDKVFNANFQNLNFWFLKHILVEDNVLYFLLEINWNKVKITVQPISFEQMLTVYWRQMLCFLGHIGFILG